MFNIGMQELILIIIIALLVVGPKRLPDVAKSLGRGLAEFRRTAEDVTDSIKGTLQDSESEPPQNERATEENPISDEKRDEESTSAKPFQEPRDESQGKKTTPSSCPPEQDV